MYWRHWVVLVWVLTTSYKMYREKLGIGWSSHIRLHKFTMLIYLTSIRFVIWWYFNSDQDPVCPSPVTRENSSYSALKHFIANCISLPIMADIPQSTSFYSCVKTFQHLGPSSQGILLIWSCLVLLNRQMQHNSMVGRNTWSLIVSHT